MSVACQPSRASIYTGQYPSLHGIAQTSGAAKTAIEQDLFWLDPTTVPTLGSWFRTAGYDTYWKGKWHISDADLYQPGSYNPLPSYNNVGGRDRYLEDVYLESGAARAVRLHGLHRPRAARQQPAELRLLRAPVARAATRSSPSSASSSSSSCAGRTTPGCSSPRS